MPANPPTLVMIHHNRPDLTRLAVLSLAQHTAPDHRLLLIDNASGDDLSGLPRHETLVNPRPLSFAANCNLGIAAAGGGPVALLNNDLYFPPGWLEGLLRGLADGLGVVGAVSNFEVPLSLGDVRLGAEADPAGLAGQWPRLDAVLNGFNQSQRARPQIPRPFVSFYAVALSPGVCARLGGLDEAFVQGVEDVDLCFRAWEAGFGVAQAPDAYVVHFSGRATEADARALARRDAHNLPLLLERWPRDRRETLLALWRRRGLEAEGADLWRRYQRRAASLAAGGAAP